MSENENWKIGVRSRSRDSLTAQGWNRLGQNSKHKGWFRGRGAERELLIYVEFDGTDSLAFSWGSDLAKKKLPLSFVVQIANDRGGFFGKVLLAGYNSFSRPPRIREGE